MPSQDLLNRAIDIAVEVHGQDRDKMGAHYLLHLFRVMARCKGFDAQVCAMLHDVVEDHSDLYDFEKLGEEFPSHIIDALRCVTKLSEDEDYDEFIDRTLTNNLAMQVKLADLEDNLDITRLDGMNEKASTRCNKYLRARQRILDRQNLMTHLK